MCWKCNSKWGWRAGGGGESYKEYFIAKFCFSISFLNAKAYLYILKFSFTVKTVLLIFLGGRQSCLYFLVAELCSDQTAMDCTSTSHLTAKMDTIVPHQYWNKQYLTVLVHRDAEPEPEPVGTVFIWGLRTGSVLGIRLLFRFWFRVQENEANHSK
jgi:hypothetical protein